MNHCQRIFLVCGLSILMCASSMAAVVINEFDYDQDSTDSAEFVELFNTGPDAVDLGTFTLELVNGSTGAVYQSFALPSASLAAGDFFVICANPATTYNCDLDVSPDTNLIQNGNPDGIALYDGSNLVDSVSYEGDMAGITEGTGAMSDTSNPFEGLSRYPNGADTNDNSLDFSIRCITPGETNGMQATDCLDPVPATESNWGTMKSMYR